MLTGAGRALWICFSTFSAIGPEIPGVRSDANLINIRESEVLPVSALLYVDPCT